MEAAIFLFSRVARLPLGSSVLPAICTEERITLGAELEDGTVVRGQNQISHPPDEDCTTSVDKSGDYDLMPSPILRVFYLSSQGSGQEHEVTPQVNPMVSQEVEKADAIVYGMGSLYTSICPSMCLVGMGETIAARQVPKVSAGVEGTRVQGQGGCQGKCCCPGNPSVAQRCKAVSRCCPPLMLTPMPMHSDPVSQWVTRPRDCQLLRP